MLVYLYLHPMEKKRKRILYWILQICGWGVYGVFLFLSILKKQATISVSQSVTLLFSVITGILFSHFMRLYFLRNHYFEFNALKIVPRIIVFSFLVALANGIVLRAVPTFINFNTTWQLLELILNVFSLYYLNVFSLYIVYILWATIYFIVLLFEEARKKEINNLLLTNTQIELELQNLRSQLNPHFLFNSLNAIRALVEVEPDKAKNAINLLSSLLRSTLKLNSEKLVSVSREMEMVESYLELEKIRFEQRLVVESEIEPNSVSLLIPAFTIQTLVENSIKHGISKLIEGGTIHIRVMCLEEKLMIEVANSGKIGQNVDLGIGIANLKKRLSHQFANQYHFNMSEVNDEVIVRIILPKQNQL